MNKNVDFQVDVRFIIKNAVDSEGLKLEFGNSPIKVLNTMLDNDRLMSFVEDGFEILDVKVAKDGKQ